MLQKASWCSLTCGMLNLPSQQAGGYPARWCGRKRHERWKQSIDERENSIDQEWKRRWVDQSESDNRVDTLLNDLQAKLDYVLENTSENLSSVVDDLVHMSKLHFTNWVSKFPLPSNSQNATDQCIRRSKGSCGQNRNLQRSHGVTICLQWNYV
jgi:hypothetical protein